MEDSDHQQVSMPLADKKVSKGFGYAFWSTLIILLVVVGALELYAAMSFEEYVQHLGERSTHQPSGDTRTQDLEAQSTWRRRVLQESFLSAQQGYEELGEQLKRDAQQDLKEVRQKALARVPIWADWYFSVIGEYLRLGHLAGQAIGQSDLGDYLVDQLSEQIFEPAGLSQTLISLNEQSQEAYVSQHRAVTSHLRTVIEQQTKTKQGVSKAEHQELNEHLMRLNKMDDLAIISPIGIAAKLTTVTGVKVLIKTIASRSAVKVGSSAIVKSATSAGLKAGGKLGAKASLRGSSAGAAGAGAAVACAPLGPGAVLCGVSAALITWFAVDKVIVEVDELINRDEYEAQIRQELNAMMDEVERDVIHSLDQHQAYVLKTLLDQQNPDQPISDETLPQTRLIDHLPIPPVRNAASKEVKRGDADTPSSPEHTPEF